MTRQQYREARRLIRDNGNFALKWLDYEPRVIFTRLANQLDDVLAWRQRMGGHCRRLRTRLQDTAS